jgi:hypothetical protein
MALGRVTRAPVVSGRGGCPGEMLGNLRSDQAKQDRDHEEQPFRSLIPRVRRSRLGIVLLMRLHAPILHEASPIEAQARAGPRRSRIFVSNAYRAVLIKWRSEPQSRLDALLPAIVILVVHTQKSAARRLMQTDATRNPNRQG